MTFDFKLPDLFSDFVHYFSFLNCDFVNALSVDCMAVQPTFLQKFVFTQSLPLFLCALILLFKRFQLRKLGRTASSTDTAVQEAEKTIRNKALNTIFLILFLLYPSLCEPKVALCSAR